MIPFVDSNFRLECEGCHSKFVKLFNNKQFYLRKEVLLGAIALSKNKYLKLEDRKALKDKEFS